MPCARRRALIFRIGPMWRAFVQRQVWRWAAWIGRMAATDSTASPITRSVGPRLSAPARLLWPSVALAFLVRVEISETTRRTEQATRPRRKRRGRFRTFLNKHGPTRNYGPIRPPEPIVTVLS